MIALDTYKDRTIAVFGLGLSGRATARALRAGGARVIAWDDSEASRAAASSDGVELADLGAAAWDGIDALVLSPGVPLTHPKPHEVVRRAQDTHRPILGDIELLWQACGAASFIGVTGTNGKSTTTALIGHILESAGRRVEIGGNLGTPALALAPLGKGGTYVLELSSYQLDLVRDARFDIAVLLNISPDHLDRHGGMEGYVAAKARIFRDGRDGPTAIIGIDDAHGRRLCEELRARGGWHVIPISGHPAKYYFAGTPPWGQQTGQGIHVADGILLDATTGLDARPVCDLRDMPTLPGAHNWQNAAAAYAAARTMGIAPDDIAAALRSFPGLPHRQETIAEIEGVRYVNDSKATNAEAAEKALVCYDRIYWIAGGLAKEGGIEALRPEFGRIRHAFLIGEAAEEFARQIGGACPATMSGDLATAVADAHRAAQADGIGAVVLLSPACASFDQFANFGARGDAFRDLVGALATGATS